MEINYSILIVDDDETVRYALAALLRTEHYYLAFAKDGEQALELAQEIKPDIILLDIMMPGLDGYEVCRRLRANPELSNVPVVLITALDDHPSRMEGLEVGADYIVSKPFDWAELRARVRTIVRLNRYRQLLEAHNRFEWILDQTPDGYLIIDVDDHLVYANPKARLYMGLPLFQTPSSDTFLETCQSQYLLRPEKNWQSWPELAPSSPYYLVRPETPNSATFWLQVHVLPSMDPNNLGFLVRLQDVTEQITQQQDIHKFHTLIEHKFRTPLTNLALSLDLLGRTARKNENFELTQLTWEAEESLNRLREDTLDIFHYLSLPDFADAEGGVLLERLQHKVSYISENLGLTRVSISIPDEIAPLRLALSEQALDMMFWEILENSQKFHPRHTPTIDVSASLVTLPIPPSQTPVQVTTESLDHEHTSLSNQDFIQILIRDNGIHLSPRQLESAWAPYVQAEKELTGQAQGMGLGLSMVSVLVWQVGGSVHLANRIDTPGVMVILNIPLAN